MVIGSTISHYRIVEKLGEGGMGVVYKAEDTKLERTVALKFLAQHLLHDDEAKQRFLREAKAAAALHHSNVCPVYEIDEVDGKTFLAMAFLQGQTLEDRITEGPLALKDALEIGRQIAAGLEAAHDAGIVHRDIKPANVLLDPKGHATIMDFGLARLTEASRLTKVDTAMGTVAYMSPEQAQGAEVDSRSDLWSLGCVLYEMVSGQRPFQGQYDQALLYEIVHEEPAALTGLRTGVPVELEFIVGKCLEKDAASRYQTAREIGVDLRNLQDKLRSGRSTILRASQMTGAVPAPQAQTLNPTAALPADAVIVPRSRQRLLFALLGVACLAAAIFGLLHFTEAPSGEQERIVRRFSFASEGIYRAEISPDGRHVAYITVDGGSSTKVWLRSLVSDSSRELPVATGAMTVFWSPDSQSLAFARDAQLQSVSLNDPNPITLCEVAGLVRGGTWSPDGEVIVFSAGNQLYRVPARGGQATLLFDASGESRRVFTRPRFLPTGSGPPALVYTHRSLFTDEQISVLNLETRERRAVGPGGQAVYSGGHLIYAVTNATDSGLAALPFSLETLEAIGESFPVTQTGGDPTAAMDGTLLYLTRPDFYGGMEQFAWRDRSGEILERVGRPQLGLREFSLSPEGRRVATTVSEPPEVWVHDLARSTTTRITTDAPAWGPAWTPDGTELGYAEMGGGLTRRRADGTGPAVQLVESRASLPDWSADGRYMVFQLNRQGANGRDIAYTDLEKEGEPQTFLGTTADELAPRLSPDGRFLAYVSDESGRLEVYVQPFPEGGGRSQVSVDGGAQPVWRDDGGELFYVEGGDTLMSVAVELGDQITLGQPERLFQSEDFVFYAPGWPQYDVSADGQRILTSAPVPDPDVPVASAHLVLNWVEEFRGQGR